jgi:archaellum biogenesis protein FlaJ (TadC family)
MALALEGLMRKVPILGHIPMTSFIIIIIIIILFTCAYPTPFLPQFQAGPVLPLSLILLKKRDKLNKEDKAFLLVELRIAIQKYS